MTNSSARMQICVAWSITFVCIALLYLPAALIFPVFRIQRLNFVQDVTVWEGVTALLRNGHYLTGYLVLACSIVFPVLKNVTLLLLNILMLKGGTYPPRMKGLLRNLSKWSFLDVFIVSVLVATVQLGDAFSVRPASLGLTTFCISMLSSFFASQLLPTSTPAAAGKD